MQEAARGEVLATELQSYQVKVRTEAASVHATLMNVSWCTQDGSVSDSVETMRLKSEVMQLRQDLQAIQWHTYIHIHRLRLRHSCMCTCIDMCAPTK